MVRIGLVQASSECSTQENLKSLAHFAAMAAESGCEVVCFPECFLTGHAPEEAAVRCVDANAPLLQEVCVIARQFSIDILAGFMEREGDRHFITHGLFRRDGSREYYHKSHLGKTERLFFTPGDRMEVFTLSCGLRIGLQLGVETHFPEITQTLALRGAEVVFSPHAVPRVSGDRKKVWGKHIHARSYDNRIYFACCNQWDETRCGGGCLVTDPRGETTAACFEDTPQLLTADIDRHLIARYRTPGDMRATHFYPGKRRRELYE